MFGCELYDDPCMNDEWPEPEEGYFFEQDDLDPCLLFPVQDEQRLVEVPKLQNFGSYIKLHFRNKLIDALCSYVISEAAGIDSEGTVTPDRDSVDFLEMSFWAESQTQVGADIKMQMLIHIKEDDDEYDYETTGTVRALFIMEQRKRVRGKIIDIYEHVQKERRKKLWYLTPDLIPRITKEDLETFTRAILQKYLPEALKDQHLNDAYKLAENMGLKVITLPLHGYKKTRTILFFRKGTISIEEKDPITDKVTVRSVSVERNTIVVNINTAKSYHDQYCIDIYHECIHFEWHYLFYRLQDMHNNDLKQIRKEYRIRYNKENVQDSLSRLEWQACRGSLCLWMPKPFMDEEIHSRGRRIKCEMRAESYEYIGTQMSSEYLIPKYRIRARMINLGRIEAKGAFNFFVDHYVRPFAFSTNTFLGKHTFFIEPREFGRLFREDEKFRSLMLTGYMVYVEGFVCIDDPAYITVDFKGCPHLTDKARQAVDKCCLRFVEIYEKDDEIGYRFGRLNSDEPFNEHYFEFPGCGSIIGLSYCEKMQKLKEYTEELPRPFPKMMTKFMNDMGMTKEQLLTATGFSESTAQRLRNKESVNYKVEKVVALVCLFHLPPIVSQLFLRSAGVNLADNEGDYVYHMIVTNMYYYSIEKLQETLESMGFSRLHLTDAADRTLEQCG